MNEVAEKFGLQVIVATHSSGLVAGLLNVSEDLGIICFDAKEKIITTVKKDNTIIFSNLLSVDLSLAVILGKKIVIVEGNDDFLVWNQAVRSQNFKDISLIQANGGDILKYKSNAEKILTAVLDSKEKLGITILDGDNKEECSNKDSDLILCERLSCYSLENLFFTNEILSFIKSDINLYEELNNLKTKDWITIDDKNSIENILKDKKNTKISKELIKKIHSHIDDHSSSRDWRIIVGKILGKGKPTGELSDFLGNNVIEYIWGKE